MAIASLAFALSILACGGGGGGGGGGSVPPALVIATSALPAAGLNVSYATSLAAIGGVAPYSWTLLPGSSTPPGITFSSPAGSILGTATVTGSYTLNVQLADSAVPATVVSKAFDLSVALDIADLVASPGPTRGTVVLQFTAPTTSGGPAVSAYVVRSSIRHISSPTDLAAATVVPQAYAPGAPGAAESITLTGLDPGQTLQFHVQTVQGASTSGFTYAVASRVAEGTLPALPGGAIALSSAPATLSTAGGVYYLTQDVSAAGTAFTITARDVTLDLNGKKITYGTAAGTAYGVRVASLTATGATTIKGGTIVQGGGGGSSCHAVYGTNLHVVRVSHLDVTVSGTDADGVSLWNLDGDVRVDHVASRCLTTVVTNRHFPGVAAIRVDGASAGAEIDHNVVTASPQWGIRLQGDASTGDVLMHHNRVQGTKALVANGYMLGVYKRNADVFENDLSAESRGIHVASDGSDGIDCRIHDNVLSVRDQLNPEYPTFHWVHGIKIEGARGCKVYDNFVTGTADAAHAEVRAVDVALQNVGGDVTGVEVRHNRVIARALDATYKAFAFHFTEGTAGPSDLVVHQNVLTATDRTIEHSWDGGRGTVFTENAFVRDLSQGAGHPFVIEDFGNGGATAPSHGVCDAITAEDPLAVTNYGSALAFDCVRQWVATIVARDGVGAAVSGASVTVTDKDGATAFSGVTAANGTLSGVVTVARITNGPATVVKNPFTVSVTKSGGLSYTGPHTFTARTAVVADLVAHTAAVDSAAPSAPIDVFANPVSASRLLVRWSPASDPSGIAGYLVRLDGVLVGVTDGTSFVIPGLAPGSSHGVGVEAIDRGGNASPAGTAGPVTQRLEDRGP